MDSKKFPLLVRPFSERQLRGAFAKMMDQYGLIQPKEGMSGNGIRYTAEYLYALHLHGYLTKDDRARYRGIYGRCLRVPGLLMRNPKNEYGQQSIDDTAALISIAPIIEMNFAGQWLTYGREKGATRIDPGSKSPRWLLRLTVSLLGIPTPFTFNNITPGHFNLSAFLGRFQQLICHAQFAVGERPPMWRKIVWCIAVLMSALKSGKKDPDAKVMAWYLVRTAKGHSRMCDVVAEIWKWRLQSEFPGGIGEVLGVYFGHNNHPSEAALWGEMG